MHHILLQPIPSSATHTPITLFSISYQYSLSSAPMHYWPPHSCLSLFISAIILIFGLPHHLLKYFTPHFWLGFPSLYILYVLLGLVHDYYQNFLLHFLLSNQGLVANNLHHCITVLPLLFSLTPPDFISGVAPACGCFLLTEKHLFLYLSVCLSYLTVPVKGAMTEGKSTELSVNTSNSTQEALLLYRLRSPWMR